MIERARGEARMCSAERVSIRRTWDRIDLYQTRSWRGRGDRVTIESDVTRFVRWGGWSLDCRLRGCQHLGLGVRDFFVVPNALPVCV